MISPNDFRKGTSFEMDGEVYEIIDFQHVKPGKGAAFVRAKIRNVINGTTKDTTFNPSDKYPQARIETKEMQYLYNDGEIYYFMDPESFEQLPISASIAQDTMKYVKDSENATIKFYQGEAFSVEPPNFVELEVTQTEPGIKGDTATGATKHAVVETGAELQVPLFIEIGDIIRIDTRDNEYQSRV